MRPDAAWRAAAQRAVSLSADVEVQLSQTTGGAPLVALLVKARNAAADSIVCLAEADSEDPALIRALQNDVKCFKHIVEWLREIVADGFEAEDELSEDERDDLAEALGLDRESADDVRETGLPPEQ